jgi:hypothetical protein
MNYALKKLQEQKANQERKTFDLLEKEAEKWEAGQQRRKALYMERGCAGPPMVFSYNTADDLTEKGLNWEFHEAPKVSTCSIRKKSGFDLLMMEINVPSLDSLMMR